MAKKSTKKPKRFSQYTKCVAPNCKQPHTGPRFRFLCVNHREKPKKAQEQWLTNARERVEKARAQASA